MTATGAGRPPVVLVAGTGTEVGKTWVAAALAGELRRRGRRVAARKPAQSFEPGDEDTGRTDAHVLATATGETPAEVCPPTRWYPAAMAPPMAATALGSPPFTIADLVDGLTMPAGADLVLVETAGGVRSPLAADGDTVTLAWQLRPALTVLVADAGLGTINAVRLSAAALDGPLVVHLNRFDARAPLHAANAAWLERRDGLRCVTSLAALAEAVDVGRTVPLQWEPGDDRAPAPVRRTRDGGSRST